jgi:putative ABC transport system substrate-binding protein
MMARTLRLFAGLSLALIAAPLTGEAQTPPGKVWRIGLLSSASAAAYGQRVEAIRRGLGDLGYVEGKNLVIEYRWAEGRYDRLPDLAAELVRLKVDLIITHGTPGSLAAKRATTTIPIVMAVAGDVVTTGLVASLARPGGNLTGSTFFFPEINAKRLELLTEALPGAKRLAALVNPDNPVHATAFKAMEQMATSLKVGLQAAEARRPDELPGAFSAMVRRQTDGVVVVDDAMLNSSVRQVADLAAKHRLPSIGLREHVEVGGLLAYGGGSSPEMWRRAAVFVDKIFKGAKPGELPIEQATRFELVINLMTAKTLGLTIPPAVLARADEVLQ